MKFDLPLLVGLSFSVSVVAYQPVYLQRRACAKNNLYRTLERLQRESAFCEALLAPNPTVTVPSSISATPIVTISSACNCIVGTQTTSITTTTTTTALSTTSSTGSTCANTVTIVPDPVTVTKTLDPVTVTETYTPTSPPTSAATSYEFSFEEPNRIWGCSMKLYHRNRIYAGFAGCGDYEDAGQARSGNWYYRFIAEIGEDEQIFRWGNLKALPVLPNTEYEISLWYRQLSYSKLVCDVEFDINSEASAGIGGPAVVNSGFLIKIFRPTASLTWTESSTSFNTGQFNQIGFFSAITCKCPVGEYCGDIVLGFDDIIIKPVVV